MFYYNVTPMGFTHGFLFCATIMPSPTGTNKLQRSDIMVVQANKGPIKPCKGDIILAVTKMGGTFAEPCRV